MHRNRRVHILTLAQEKLAGAPTAGPNMADPAGRAAWVQGEIAAAGARNEDRNQRHALARAGSMTSDILPHEKGPDGSASPDYAARQIWAGGQRVVNRDVANTAARAAATAAPTGLAAKTPTAIPGGPAQGAAPPQPAPAPPPPPSPLRPPPPVPYPSVAPASSVKALPPQMAPLGR